MNTMPGKQCCMAEELQNRVNGLVGKVLTDEEIVKVHAEFETHCTKIFLNLKDVPDV